MTAAAFAFAVLLALAPWEFADGVRVGGLTITLPEMMAAMALLASGVALWRDRRQPDFGQHLRQCRGPLMAFGLWALVHLLSVAWAPTDHLLVLKYSLRVAGAMALATCALVLGRHPPFRRTVLVGLIIGLLMMVVLGVLERRLGRDLELFLTLFRAEPTWMLGEQRLALTFSHANGAAGYFELAVPPVLVVLAMAKTHWLRAGLIVVALVCAILLSLTYSRAGFGSAIVGAALLWVAAAGFAGAARRWLRRAALGYALVVVGAYVANPEMRARIGVDEHSYAATYTFERACVGHVGETVLVPVHIRNRGRWALSDRAAPGSVMHTLLTPMGKRVVPYWDHHPLAPMPPHTERTELLRVVLPQRAGEYALAVDVMREQVLRISQLGNPVAWLGCMVHPAGVDLQAAKLMGAQLRPPLDTSAVASGLRFALERRHYWRAALLLWERHPWLGIGADRFRLAHREYLPFLAYDDRARAHSVPAETAVDLGLLGLSVLALLVWQVGRRLWSVARYGSGDWATVAVLGSLGGLAVHSQVDFFLCYTQLSMIIWPLVGIACGAVPVGRPPGLRNCDNLSRSI
ncbi:MAG: hypothetical protein EXR77_03465 [Myxococcales bacterium]|nr:hypothetical protein [Myxococcales bacterium]